MNYIRKTLILDIVVGLNIEYSYVGKDKGGNIGNEKNIST